MSQQYRPQDSSPEDEFARRVTTRLSESCTELPHHVTERLRVGREKALARHSAQPLVQSNLSLISTTGWLTHNSGPLREWHRMAALLPALALVAGLLAISLFQDEMQITELVDLDTALLADDLPPTAYADIGFAQFLKANHGSSR